MTQTIVDSADPRVAEFTDIREKDLVGRRGLLMAEGEVVLRVLASSASRARIRAVLLSEHQAERLKALTDSLPDSVVVMQAAQPVLDSIVGFNLHRGILALAEKPAPVELSQMLASADPTAPVLLACGIGNHDNMGGLFRNAAAFGAAGAVLDPHCCDPFYRKAIRVSVGAVLRTPLTIMEPLEAIRALRDSGRRVYALSPSAAQNLNQIDPAEPAVIVVGSEGPGLTPEVMAVCEPVGIPMAGGFDSLNVAVTSALALNHFTQQARSTDMRP